MNITNINVENGFFTSKYGAELSESSGIKFKNITVIPEIGPAIKINNLKNFDLKEFNCPPDLQEVVKATGKNIDVSLPATIDKNKISGL